LALDLLIDTAVVDLPDRIGREVFQIYREALHSKKTCSHDACRGKTVAK
jgi:hypothetical protein